MQRAQSSRKISVRFSGEAARKLRALERGWDATTSEVLTRAVTEAADRLERERTRKPDAYDILMESGLIGSLKGRPDASTTYKEDVADYIAAKHGLGR